MIWYTWFLLLCTGEPNGYMRCEEPVRVDTREECLTLLRYQRAVLRPRLSDKTPLYSGCIKARINERFNN